MKKGGGGEWDWVCPTQPVCAVDQSRQLGRGECAVVEAVPVKQARKQLILHAYPFRIEILDDTRVIATHARCYGREQEMLDPLHDLPLLEQRPGAFEYARPMRVMRQTWPAVYDRALTYFQQPDTDTGGIRERVRILRLLEAFPAAQVEAAVAAAPHKCPPRRRTHPLHPRP